jgi:hypothetical protein
MHDKLIVNYNLNLSKIFVDSDGVLKVDQISPLSLFSSCVLDYFVLTRLSHWRGIDAHLICAAISAS